MALMLKLVKYQQFILAILGSIAFFLIGAAIVGISLFSANREQTTGGIKEIFTEIINPAESDYLVAKVIDGDTIKLANGDTIRYIGVNTPESVHPKIKLQCFGKEASDYNQQLVAGKTVTLEKDVSETDKYGRLLRYVYVDGEMINEKLVHDGYALVATYPPDVKYTKQFLAGQTDARLNRRGLWSKCNYKEGK